MLSSAHIIFGITQDINSRFEALNIVCALSVNVTLDSPIFTKFTLAMPCASVFCLFFHLSLSLILYINLQSFPLSDLFICSFGAHSPCHFHKLSEHINVINSSKSTLSTHSHSLYDEVFILIMHFNDSQISAFSFPFFLFHG